MHTQLNLKIGLLLHFWPSSVMYMLQKWYISLSKLIYQILILKRVLQKYIDSKILIVKMKTLVIYQRR